MQPISLCAIEKCIILIICPFSPGEGLRVGTLQNDVVFKFSSASVPVLAEMEARRKSSHSKMSQKCSCQWEQRQAPGMTPYVPDDFGKTLTATQEGKLFSLLFSQAASWLKAKWVTLLDTPNQPTALIFHTDGSCVSKQHAAKDKRRKREWWSRVTIKILLGNDAIYLNEHDHTVTAWQKVGRRETVDQLGILFV